jgi:hypothetical protein
MGIGAAGRGDGDDGHCQGVVEEVGVQSAEHLFKLVHQSGHIRNLFHGSASFQSF